MSIRKVQDGADCVEAAPPFRPGLRLALSHRDPDEMSERSIHWGIEQSQLGSGRFDGSTLAIHSGHIQLSYAHRSPGLLVRGEVPGEAVVLSSIVRQSAPVYFNGRRIRDDHIVRADARRAIDFRTLGGNTLITVAVHAPLFEALARATLGPGFFDDKPSDLLRCDSHRRPRLNQRLVTLLDEGLAESDRLGDPVYCRNWEYRVLSVWLADVIAPDPGATPTARHRAARQAEAFLRANSDRPTSIGELCLATGVAKRTLMLGFQEAFGISPLAYHRRLRLNVARRDLMRSSPRDMTVAQVALRWGFEHLGRFSVDYHRLFGETPTTTLRS